jgi:AcrR family transcriptional regulator
MATDVRTSEQGRVSPTEEGLRARKKRAQRQELSDTATRLFLDRGFDHVTVAEVARECGVSETTVFNYFPTKEALLLDRLDGAVNAIIGAIAEHDGHPAAAVADVLSEQLRSLLARRGRTDSEVIEGLSRFGLLLRSTPSLRAHVSNFRDGCTASAAAALAARYGTTDHDPRVAMAAMALIGLWQVQSDSLCRVTSEKRSIAQVKQVVDAEIRAAAALLEQGLSATFES